MEDLLRGEDPFYTGSSSQIYTHEDILTTTQDRSSDILVNEKECDTKHRLIEYVARNRNRFLLVMNNDGDILNVVKKNGPLTIFDRQKHHIENIIGKGDFSRFSEHPNNEATQALITRIEENQRRKILGNIKHPEISGVYSYTNSKDKKLIVQIKSGKVISIDPMECNSPQQRGAIQKKLNKFGKEAKMETCSEGVELLGLYSLVEQYGNMISDSGINNNELVLILEKIFTYLKSNFPNKEYNWDDENADLNFYLKRIQVLLKKMQENYPPLWDKCEYIKSIFNRIKDLLTNSR